MTLILFLISSATGAVALTVICLLIEPGHEMTRDQYRDVVLGVGCVFAMAMLFGLEVSKWIVAGMALFSLFGMIVLMRLYWTFPRPLSRLARLFNRSRDS
jgi:uncharacterized membrane protein